MSILFYTQWLNVKQWSNSISPLIFRDILRHNRLLMSPLYDSGASTGYKLRHHIPFSAKSNTHTSTSFIFVGTFADFHNVLLGPKPLLTEPNLNPILILTLKSHFDPQTVVWQSKNLLNSPQFPVRFDSRIRITVLKWYLCKNRLKNHEIAFILELWKTLL